MDHNYSFQTLRLLRSYTDRSVVGDGDSRVWVYGINVYGLSGITLMGVRRIVNPITDHLHSRCILHMRSCGLVEDCPWELPYVDWIVDPSSV